MLVTQVTAKLLMLFDTAGALERAV